MSTLKPCPFCGSVADTDFVPEHHSYRLECRDTFGCGAQITAETEDDVIARWNTRSAAQGVWQPVATAPLDDAVLMYLHRIDNVTLGHKDASGQWWSAVGNKWSTSEISHWMPLPAPPKV